MCRFLLTEKAVKDLTEIWNYTIDAWSENQADKYYDELLNFFQTLAENPQNGRNYSQLIPNLKGAKINRHIVFCREISENVIEIERVLHEKMDLKTRLEK
jgi:toxin ParE1/3/4